MIYQSEKFVGFNHWIFPMVRPPSTSGISPPCEWGCSSQLLQQLLEDARAGSMVFAPLTVRRSSLAGWVGFLVQDMRSVQKQVADISAWITILSPIETSNCWNRDPEKLHNFVMLAATNETWCYAFSHSPRRSDHVAEVYGHCHGGNDDQHWSFTDLEEIHLRFAGQS